MKLLFNGLRDFVARFTKPRKGEGGVSAQVGACIPVFGYIVGHPAVGGLKIRGPMKGFIGQLFAFRPFEMGREVPFEGSKMAGHHPFGQDLFPAGVGIIFQILKGPFKIAQHRGRHIDGDPSLIGSHLFWKPNGFRDGLFRGTAVLGGCFKEIAFIDREGMGYPVSVRFVPCFGCKLNLACPLGLNG